MNTEVESYSYALEQAKNSLRDGDHGAARAWAQQAIRLDHSKEDAWLILAAVSSPKASIEYLNRALQINPSSTRAQKGMAWAVSRIQTIETPLPSPVADQPLPRSPRAAGSARRNIFAPILAILAMLIFVGFLIFSLPALQALQGNNKPSASASQKEEGTSNTPTAIFMAVANPEQVVFSINSEHIPTTIPVLTTEITPEPILLPTAEPALTREIEATPAAVTEMPFIDFVDDAVAVTPYRPPAIPTDTPPPDEISEPEVGPDSGFIKPQVAAGERWVDVDLSQQRVFAFEGDQIVRSFLVSTGKKYTPTVKGQYRIYVKLRTTNMSGPGYFLEGVPYVMYFYKGYGLHGTYWHDNFGTPMSHGCVNFRIKDAKWLFEWAKVGTLVSVHK